MADGPPSDFVARLAARAAALDVDPTLTFSLEQRIENEPEATWHVDISAGRVEVGPGPHAEPTITLTNPRRVADAVRRGELSAQRAFLDGDLRIGGDIAALLEHKAALEVVAALLTAT